MNRSMYLDSTEEQEKDSQIVWLLAAYRPSNMLAYLKDGSAQTI